MGKIKSTKITPKSVGRFLLNNAIIELLIIMALIVGFTTNNFFTMRNFNNLAMNTSIRFLIALGVSGCLITKGTDLSAGRAAGLAACVGGVLIGVLVFEILKICLQFMNVNPYYNYIVQGLVIVLAVSLDIRKYLAKK